MKAAPLRSWAAPRCVELEDAYLSRFALLSREQFVPVGPGSRRCRVATLGAVYTSEGACVELSRRPGGRGGDHVLSVDPPTLGLSELAADCRPMPGRSMYLGHFMNHYGHFLTEGISRMWCHNRFAEVDNFVFVPFMFNHGRFVVQGYHEFLLSRLGIPRDKIRLVARPLRFEKLLVPEQLWTINGRAHPSLAETYRRIADPHRGARVLGKVFLSRRSPKRLRNMPAVDRVFERFGFAIVFPEELTMSEQLQIYANCELLAGYSGSGMHNAVFCQPGAMLIEVGDPRSPTDFHVMQKLCNGIGGISVARYIPYHGTPDGDADVGHVEQALRTILAEQGLA